MTDVPLLPEYAENPFIAGLGPLLTIKQIEQRMTVAPNYSPDERRQHSTYRRNCCLRLSRAFFPLPGHVMAADALHMMVRNGYIARNPADGGFGRAVLEAVERLEQDDLDLEFDGAVVGTVGSAATVGVPGMGKTTTYALASDLFPRVLRPALGRTVVQIPVIPVQCPIDGSVKQFCRNFFKAVDRRLGWRRYRKEFGKNSIPAETMLLHVQHLCHLHAIGVLIVDEVQNLLSATGANAGALMKFYVTMTNTIGIPVQLVGTMSSTEFLQHGFHAARRADGVGSAVWDRASRGPEWDAWLEKVWQFQWTASRTRLTDDLKAAVYRETQGVLDLAVKLLMLVQMRLITAAEFTDAPEVITVGAIEEAAAKHFNMVRPMIEAMREGKVDVLDRFRDISGFQAAIDASLASMAGLTTEEYRRRIEMERAAQEAPLVNDPFHLVRASLKGQGLSDKVVDGIVLRAEASVPSGDHLLVLSSILELAAAAKAEGGGASRPKTPKIERAPVDDPDDARNLASPAALAKVGRAA